MLTQQRRQNPASKSSAVRKQQGGIAYRPPVQFKKTGFATGTVQRYQANDLGGAIDASSYGRRAGAFGQGLNGFSQSNKGWALVTTNAGVVHRIERESGGDHTEEILLQAIIAQFGNILMNDPANGALTRITQIYTERRPCGAGGENPGYHRSQRNDGSCNAMLHNRIHNNIVVSYSVANSDHAHGQLMQDEFNLYCQEIVNDTRRITAGNMRNRLGALGGAQVRTRQLCHAATGNYGRDYNAEYQVLAQARADVTQAHTQIANIEALTGGVLPPALALLPMLADLDAQFMGAHQAGSAPILAAIAARRLVHMTALGNYAAQIYGFGDQSGSDKKGNDPPPPPSGSSGNGSGKDVPMAPAADNRLVVE